MTHTVRPKPRLSFRRREAKTDGTNSSLDPMEGVPCRTEEASDTPEIDPVTIGALDIARIIGNAALFERGLPPLRDVVRVCAGEESTKRSATLDGGERGKDVRNGRLPGELVSESLCWFLNNVGVNSGPSSCERNRDDSSDSRSKILNSGLVR